MKTQEELEQLRQECEDLATKFQELTDDEIMKVTGGNLGGFADWIKKMGEGIKNVVKPVVKSFRTVSPEEELGGKVIVVPSDEREKFK